MRGLVVVLIAGCSYTPRTPAAGDDAPPPDDATDAPDRDAPAGADCFAAWKAHTVALTAPAVLANVNSTAEDRDPFISRDEKTVFFASRRSGGLGGADVYVATRQDASGDFSTPAPQADFNTGSDDGKMSLSDDGLIAVVASARGGGAGGVDIWTSVRLSTADDFPTFTQNGMGAVNSSTDEQDAQLTGDGKRLYFAVGSAQHLAVASRTDAGNAFGTPMTVIDSGSGDADPTLSPDELVIAFSSNRVGSGFGGSNLWYATRTSTSEAFGEARAIPDVNGNTNDGDPVFSRDGCRLYYDRDSGVADYELVVASVR